MAQNIFARDQFARVFTCRHFEYRKDPGDEFHILSSTLGLHLWNGLTWH